MNKTKLKKKKSFASCSYDQIVSYRLLPKLVFRFQPIDYYLLLNRNNVKR